MEKSIGESVEVYLTGAERDVLDRCALELGISRSKVLRRGLRIVGESVMEGAFGTTSPPDALLDFLIPAVAGPGAPPPSRPVAPLKELLEDLARDRDVGTSDA